MTKSKERKEFERIKRNGKVYEYLGGKKDDHDIHHKKLLSQKGTNLFSNFVYIISFAHRLLHKYLNRNESTDLDWDDLKTPTIEETYDVIADGLIKKTKQNLYAECIKEEMRSR